AASARRADPAWELRSVRASIASNFIRDPFHRERLRERPDDASATGGVPLRCQFRPRTALGKMRGVDRTGRPLIEKERSFSLSALADRLRGSGFIVTAELNPPKSASATVVRRRAEALKGFVDAIKSGAPKLVIGATASPFAKPMDADVVKTVDKISAGAEFFQTQPVFDLATFSQWLVEIRRHGSRDVPILAGVLVLRSAEQADRLAKVPGLAIGREVLDRMNKAADA